MTFGSIDEYISQFPAETQEKLIMIRKVIKESAPDAVEKISYQMPTFALHGNLVYFAAFKNHIGFYPAPVQFPLGKPLPYELISRIVKFRVAENIKKAELKKKGKRKTISLND